jgi:hypothetical protein
LAADKGGSANGLEALLAVSAGAVVSETTEWLGNEFPEQVKPPEGSSEQLHDRKQQEQELLEEEQEISGRLRGSGSGS